MDWDFNDNLVAEQFNTLLLLDKQFDSARVKPVFHILGGTALLFHGVESVVTIDIDVANKLTDEIKQVVEPFVSDAASEVAVLPKLYETRLVPYKEDCFKNIKVYLLSIEDLIITKLGAGRFKDIEDLTKTGIFKNVDLGKITSIINAEFPSALASQLLIQLLKIEDYI